jgi:hypothetical protein
MEDSFSFPPLSAEETSSRGQRSIFTFLMFFLSCPLVLFKTSDKKQKKTNKKQKTTEHKKGVHGLEPH